MSWLNAFFRSFRYAGAGICRTIRTQRNMRVHLTAACYSLWAGYLARLSPEQMALIILCCGLVMGLELVNTALEALCDKVTTQWDEQIRTAKDAAAGGVLIAAIASVGVAIWLLGDWIVSGGLWQLACGSPLLDVGVLASLIAAFLFIKG